MSATRSGTLSAEAAARRYLDVVYRELEPDPLFRRRLRGTVVNRFVAEREGAAWPELPRPHRMGALGRACLYASLATAISVSGVMAASEAAVPGDLLYPLKLSIEEVRAHVAPAHLQDELAAYALGERIDELGRLIESGDLARATELATTIGRTYEQLVTTSEGSDLRVERLATHLARLDDVLGRVPANAREAIERAMTFAPGLQPDVEEHGRPATDGDGSSVNRSGGDGQRGAGAGTGAPEPTPRPQNTPESDTTTKPEATQRPGPSSRPEPSALPDPSSRPVPPPTPDRNREPSQTGP
jgi:hypothetical protein